MPVRIRISRSFWSSRAGFVLLGVLLLLVVAGLGVFAYYNYRLSRLIEQRLSGQIFENASGVYAAPETIALGQELTPGRVAGRLIRAGYSEEGKNEYAVGHFEVDQDRLQITPGALSYFAGSPAVRLEFREGKVARISDANGGERASYQLEPLLITNLFDRRREKRRLVRYQDIPRVLVEAVLAAEDKRFFRHRGVDYWRILGAAWADLRAGEVRQGGSTITMQLARGFFLTRERTFRRKIAETLIALQLEKRLSKEEIFELYANQVYLGQRGSFSIIGFGEAAQAYFGKDIKQLTLPEAALLAGLIRGPNLYSPYKSSDKARDLRNLVLDAMFENGSILREQCDYSKRLPLRLSPPNPEASDAPYFVDMVKDHLLERYSEADLTTQSYRIYTTLDMDLQRAASEAMRTGLAEVDEKIAQRFKRRARRGEPIPQVQACLVAIDPRTGEIKALVGGRNYGQSQLNHVLALRQPGSAFKPFVYAAAFESGIDDTRPLVTPTTTLVDEPTTFEFDGKEYTPANYGEKFMGVVTARQALALSLNVATVKLAEMVSYDRVVNFALRAGLSPRIKPTPAVALGAYDITPLEIAGAYTTFANHGERVEPLFVRAVLSADGKVLERGESRSRPVMDARLAYLMTNLMEDVVNRGTGAGVRARGFTAPAAGKTGTSHDGWFAGYTTNLLAVVWVGFDDAQELGLSGANSAAPIWAEFMKRAVGLLAYRNVAPFSTPPGIISVEIDPETLQLASAECPSRRTEVYIAGTEPHEFCVKHGRHLSEWRPLNVLSRLLGIGKSGAAEKGKSESHAAEAKGAAAAGSPAGNAGAQAEAPAQEQSRAEEATPRKRGALSRILSIFAGKKEEKKKTPSQQTQP